MIDEFKISESLVDELIQAENRTLELLGMLQTSLNQNPHATGEQQLLLAALGIGIVNIEHTITSTTMPFLHKTKVFYEEKTE